MVKCLIANDIPCIFNAEIYFTRRICELAGMNSCQQST